MIHVRQIIKAVDYDELANNGYIPLLVEHVKRQRKTYPAWVTKDKNYSQYGIFMDYLVRRMLMNITECELGEPDFNNSNYEDRSLDWNEVIYECYQLSCQHYNGYTKASKDEIEQDRTTYQDIYNKLNSQWKSLNLGKAQFNQEYNYQKLTSHPDIVTELAVIDIKTTKDFSKMSRISFLQVLTYYAILKSLNYNIKYIGILLPLQRDIMLYDIEKWDYRPFFNVIISKIDEYYNCYSLCLHYNLFNTIGTHIRKDRSISQSLCNHIDNCGNKIVTPCQMFLRATVSGKILILPQQDQELAATLVNDYNLSYFTHAPYSINLSQPATKKEPDNLLWSLDLLIDDLKITASINGRGVVVHVGKYNNLSEPVALDKMYESICYVLSSASPQCPLILETPAGQGSELCTTLESLSDFYNRFTPEQQQLFKICIDTAHVFALGYLPIDYILNWVKINGSNSIGLIHLNDSKLARGSHVDRHAAIGSGFMGLANLMPVILWCHDNNIPMVVE